MAGTATRATRLLARRHVPHTLHPYETSPDTPDYGRAVAEELGVPPERLFKTLVADVDDRLAVALVPTSGDLDLKALAAVVGGKRAALADQRAAERATGYVRGGISPLGQHQALPMVADSSATGLSTVYINAGRRGLQIELAPADLLQLTSATVAPLLRVRSR